MDEDTNKIKQHLETEREELGRNLEEMEYRVKNMTDPKVYFEKHTCWILGAGVAGGFLLSLAIRKASTANNNPSQSQLVRERSALIDPPRFGSTQLHRVAETVDTIFDGLVDVVSDKLHSFIADAVPGFQKQFDERHRARSA